ncbi:hypothetical protein XENOCAPTIV_009950 [Xenoophorus captivus]|uniref:Uncharacterized protein n=1 Tax=Xenoophorus captivus TaxID=1517983 RepID=A0ABV0Q942_9TELE
MEIILVARIYLAKKEPTIISLIADEVENSTCWRWIQPEGERRDEADGETSSEVLNPSLFEELGRKRQFVTQSVFCYRVFTQISMRSCSLSAMLGYRFYRTWLSSSVLY